MMPTVGNQGDPQPVFFGADGNGDPGVNILK